MDITCATNQTAFPYREIDFLIESGNRPTTDPKPLPIATLVLLSVAGLFVLVYIVTRVSPRPILGSLCDHFRDPCFARRSRTIGGQFSRNTVTSLDPVTRQSVLSTQKPPPRSRSAQDQSLEHSNITTTLPGIGQVACLSPFIFIDKGEDQIFSGLLADNWPTLILADGASSVRLPSGEIVSGGGASAAVIAVNTARVILGTLLMEKPPIVSLLQGLAEIFRNVDSALRLENEKLTNQGKSAGSTTLIIGLLYTSRETQSPFWCYGYLGNGELVVLSPSRNLGNRIASTLLVTPHTNDETTITLPLSSSLRHFSPVIGLIPYQPGDVLYAASDGITAITKFLRLHKKITVGHYFWKSSFEQVQVGSIPQLPDILNDPSLRTAGPIALSSVLRDDTTIGVIWTSS